MNREGHRAGSVTPRRFAMLVTATCLGCVATMAVASLVGSTRIDPWRALGDRHSFDAQILFRARLPRVLFAAIVGAALAASGVVFQAILRNPLASPFTLGISGGILGAVLAIRLGWEARAFGLSFLPVASLLGAFAVAAVIMLALGVAASIFSRHAVALGRDFEFRLLGSDPSRPVFLRLHAVVSDPAVDDGGLDVYDYGVFLNVGPFVLAGGTLLVYLSRYLNVLSAGDEWATSRGLDVRRLISLEYVGASLVTGSVVAYCGPIGVGLIVPHALRLVVGADHRVLLPTALFVGAAFLVACDTIARTCWPQLSFLSASLPPFSEGRSFYGSCSAENAISDSDRHARRV